MTTQNDRLKTEPFSGRQVTRDEFFYVMQDNYDAHAELAIPGYREMHTALVDLLGRVWRSDDVALRVLDLGAGTGKTTAAILRRFGKSHAVCIDLFDEMLSHAADRFAQEDGMRERVELRSADFMTADLGSGFDLCVSALAIHHQDPPGKRSLFREVYQALRPGGYFCIIDWVKFGEQWKNEAALAAAESHVRVALERAGREGRQRIPDSVASNWTEVADAWVEHWRTKNLPDTEDDLCSWLEAAGFRQFFCAVRHFGMAFIYAVK